MLFIVESDGLSEEECENTMEEDEEERVASGDTTLVGGDGPATEPRGMPLGP